MTMRDYSQFGDPYGILEEYTAQSADRDVQVPYKSSGVAGSKDVRGNTILVPRGIPTQAEADAITNEVRKND